MIACVACLQERLNIKAVEFATHRAAKAAADVLQMEVRSTLVLTVCYLLVPSVGLMGFLKSAHCKANCNWGKQQNGAIGRLNALSMNVDKHASTHSRACPIDKWCKLSACHIADLRYERVACASSKHNGVWSRQHCQY